MKDFRHPHILGLVGVCFDAPDGSPYIVLPFMANGSVKTYLRQKRVHVANFEEFPEVRLYGCVLYYMACQYNIVLCCTALTYYMRKKYNNPYPYIECIYSIL